MDDKLKAAIGLVLLLTWLGLLVFRVPNAADLITFCRDGLIGLGVFHIGDTAGQRRAETPDSPPSTGP